MRQTAGLIGRAEDASRGSGGYSGERDMDLTFLVGAILGSGLFILAGRKPARQLLATLQKRSDRE